MNTLRFSARLFISSVTGRELTFLSWNERLLPNVFRDSGNDERHDAQEEGHEGEAKLYSQACAENDRAKFACVLGDGDGVWLDMHRAGHAESQRERCTLVCWRGTCC